MMCNSHILLFVLTWHLFLFVISAKGYDHDDIIRKIKGCGYIPSSVVDVGAAQGKWTTAFKEQYNVPDIHYFMIEANPYLKPELELIKEPFEIAVISNVVKNVTFHIGDGGSSGSSIFRENSEYDFSPKNVTATTIDEILDRRMIPAPQILKIDIQGAELLALRGATKTLQSVDVLFLEVPIMNYNQGSPSFLRLYSYVYRKGFELFYMNNYMHVNDWIIQFDAVFVKRTSMLWDKNCTTYPKPFYFEKDIVR